MAWLGLLNLLIVAIWLYRLSRHFPDYSLRRHTISRLATSNKTKNEFVLLFLTFSLLQLIFASSVTQTVFGSYLNISAVLFFCGASLLGISSFFQPVINRKHSTMVTTSVLFVLAGALTLSAYIWPKSHTITILFVMCSLALPIAAICARALKIQSWELWLIATVISWNVLGIGAIFST